MNKIEKLKDISKAGTKGSWAFVDVDTGKDFYPVVTLCKTRFNGVSKNFRKENAILIAEMRNNFDALLAIAQAAKDMDIQWYCRCEQSKDSPTCDPCNIKMRLKAFEEID